MSPDWRVAQDFNLADTSHKWCPALRAFCEGGYSDYQTALEILHNPMAQGVPSLNFDPGFRGDWLDTGNCCGLRGPIKADRVLTNPNSLEAVKGVATETPCHSSVVKLLG